MACWALVPVPAVCVASGLSAHSLGVGRPVNFPVSGNRRTEVQLPPVAQQPVQYLLILWFAAKSDYFAHPAAFLVLPLIQPYPKGRSKYTVRYALETHIFSCPPYYNARRRDNQGGRLLAGGRAPAPRLPDGGWFLSPLYAGSGRNCPPLLCSAKAADTWLPHRPCPRCRRWTALQPG